MALSKIQAESMNLADTYAFTGTVSGAGGVNTPAFKAQVTSNLGPFTGNAWTDISFGTELFDTANAFDGTTFTVPETGKYYFATFVRLDDVSSSNMYYQLDISGASQTTRFTLAGVGFDTTVPFLTMGYSAILSQNQNDQIKVRLFQSSTVSSYIKPESWFCGFKIIE